MNRKISHPASRQASNAPPAARIFRLPVQNAGGGFSPIEAAAIEAAGASATVILRSVGTGVVSAPVTAA